MKSKMLVGLLTIPLLVSSPVSPHNAVFKGNIEQPKIKNIHFETRGETLNRMIEEQKEKNKLEEIERQKKIAEQKRKEEEQRERQRIAEQKKKEQALNINRGSYTKVREITVDVTYYFAEDSALQGGHNDKKGKPLAGHGMAVCALPSDVPYGSMLVLDEPVVVDTGFNKSNKLKNVDTGGAITWLNPSKTKAKVDVFVKGCYSLDWIINNLQNKKSVKAKLYYAQ